MESKSKKVARQLEKTATRGELLSLAEKQGYRCALSGIQLSPDDASLDHIKSVANGGSHEIDNLQILHKEINRMKGTLSNEEFIALCRKVCQWTA